jgi:hypothetical protein
MRDAWIIVLCSFQVFAQPATDSLHDTAAAIPESDSKVFYSSRFCPIPGFVEEYFLGKNNRLPEGELFLLGRSDLFIIKKRLSSRIDIGLAGGPALRAPLKRPRMSIDIALHNADRGIDYYAGMLAPDGAFDSFDEIPFDYNARDGDRVRITTYKSTDFPGAGLRSLQWYVNARLPTGDVYLMLKPLAFGEHVVFQSKAFKAQYDYAQSTMLFSKEDEATIDFPVRNVGIRADGALNRQVDRRLSLYLGGAAECRKITTDSTRSFVARFTYHPDANGRYRRYVTLDTLQVGASSATYVDLSPRVGFRIDSKARLSWPYVFLPFMAQKVTAEGYYRCSRLLERDFEEANPWIEELGGSLTSFQKIKFRGGLFTGMGNTFSARLEGPAGKPLKEYRVFSEYIPQLTIKEKFFISLFRVFWEIDRRGISQDHDKQCAVGYLDDRWGLSCSVSLKSWLNGKKIPEAFNIALWREWK